MCSCEPWVEFRGIKLCLNNVGIPNNVNLDAVFYAHLQLCLGEASCFQFIRLNADVASFKVLAAAYVFVWKAWDVTDGCEKRPSYIEHVPDSRVWSERQECEESESRPHVCALRVSASDRAAERIRPYVRYSH